MTSPLGFAMPESCRLARARSDFGGAGNWIVPLLLMTASLSQAGATIDSVNGIHFGTEQNGRRVASFLHGARSDTSAVGQTDALGDDQQSWAQFWNTRSSDSVSDSASNSDSANPVVADEPPAASHDLSRSAPVLIPIPTALFTGSVGLLGVGLMIRFRAWRWIL